MTTRTDEAGFLATAREARAKLDEWQQAQSRQNPTQAQRKGRSVPAPEGVEL
jgi:hypothetical protein